MIHIVADTCLEIMGSHLSKCYDRLSKHVTIRAKYEHGVFKPLDAVNIKEGTIVAVRVPRQEKSKPTSIRDLGFAGMWADRDDITDGLSYVNRLRDSPRG